MNASSDFTGAALRFSVEGPGVVIDPVTGTLSIPTDVLRDGVAVTVTATNDGGVTTSRFRLTVALPEAAPEPVIEAPSLTGAPALIGSGVVGTEITVDPGTWDGAETLALAWLRNGAPIAGAEAAVYVPLAADDGTEITVRVTATNAGGATEALTEALRVTHAAPEAVDVLDDVALTLGDAPVAIDAAAVFEGAALVFMVTGEGATIDAATGLLTLAPDALRTETVTVDASNSGGTDEAGFLFTVAAAAEPEPEPQPEPEPEPQPEPEPEPEPEPQPEPVPVLEAPLALGTIADVTHALGSGVQTVSAQAGFLGEALAYELAEAPDGVTINAGSGLVAIPTDGVLEAAVITVIARNAAGSASSSFRVTVQAVTGGVAFVGQAYRASSTVALPAETQSGDLCLIAASGVGMAAPADWTILHDATEAGTGRRVVFAWKCVDAVDTGSGTWTGANRLLASVYRGAAADPVRAQAGGVLSSAGNNAQAVYPAFDGFAPGSRVALLQFTPTNAPEVPAHPALEDRRLAPGNGYNRLRLMDGVAPAGGLAEAASPYIAGTVYHAVLIEIAAEAGQPPASLPPAPQDGDWDIDQVTVD